MSREDTDEVRARRKRVPMNSADAEAYIRAQREARQEFERNEDKPLYEHDEEMDRLHQQHSKIGAEEVARQREFTQKLRDNQQRHEREETQRQQLQQGPADRDRVVQFAMEQDQKQREERQNQEQQGRSM